VKILTVVYSLEKGGTERAAQNFAEAYRDLGHSSKVLFTKHSGVRRDQLIDNNIDVYGPIGTESLGVLRDWKPDVLHIHSHGLTFNDVAFLKSTLLPRHTWETNVFSHPSEFSRFVDKSFQLSKWCQYLYLKRGGELSKTCVVPYPVITTRFQRSSQSSIDIVRRKLGLSIDDIVIGRIGQSYDGKWSPHLISVFDKLRENQESLKLLVVDPPPSVRNRIANSKFYRDAVICEAVTSDEELANLYSSIDVFCHIAEQGESFGMVLAESLLCETPVVTLATPWGDNSQAEVIGGGRGGYVASSLREFEQFVQNLIANSDKRRKLGREGRNHILSTFDSRVVAQLALRLGAEPSYQPRQNLCPSKLYYSSIHPSPHLRYLLKADKLHLTAYASGYKKWSEFIRSTGHAIVRKIARRLGLV
jgi:glycosyltransferase involved in cell wall biosynthesis